MKYILITFVFIAQFGFTQNEQSVTLEQCVQWTKQNYPQIKQSALSEEYSASQIKTLNENWYPKLAFYAKANYQTEVVQFNFPGITTHFPHDTYLTQVSLEQTLFDGGQTATQKRVERLNGQVEVQKNEVELYKLVDRVAQLYVSVLLSDENLKILDLYNQNLAAKQKDVEAGIQNGTALESSLDEVQAEILKTDQQIIEGKETLHNALKLLSYYTGKTVTENTVFSLDPIGGNATNTDVQRPELRLMDLQREMLGERFKLTNKFALPKVALYADGNYGRPGPNFLNQSLRSWGNVGISIKWNISSLYGLSKEQKRFDINQRMIDVQREIFLFNIRNSLETQTGQINSNRELISRDSEIVQKRKKVTSTASAQLQNGRITFTDYLLQLNAEMQASMNQKIHEIKLMNAISGYNITRGITNF